MFSIYEPISLGENWTTHHTQLPGYMGVDRHLRGRMIQLPSQTFHCSPYMRYITALFTREGIPSRGSTASYTRPYSHLPQHVSYPGDGKTTKGWDTPIYPNDPASSHTHQRAIHVSPPIIIPHTQTRGHKRKKVLAEGLH